jgi:hypothetical protein
VPGQYPDAPFQLANIIGYDLPDAEASTWLGVGRKGERLRGYKDFSLEPTKDDKASSLEAGAADDAYGLKAYSYWSDLGPPHLYHWRKHDIESGALFLIPFGDLPEKLAGYRGASMFRTDWKTQCMSIPQVHLQELLTVSKTIYLSKNRVKHMGWKLMEADPIPALAWNIEADGWLKNPCRVYFGLSCIGKTLVLHSDWNEKTKLLVHNGGESFSVVADSGRTYSIPLKSLKDGFITVSTNNGMQHRDESRHLLLHLDRAEIR